MSVESHGDDDDDDASWGKILTRTPELFGTPTSRDIWERVGGKNEVRVFLVLVSFLRQKIFNMS
jgi:hypothetical protein